MRCQSHVGRACAGGLPWRVPCRLVLMHAMPQGWWPPMACGSFIPGPPVFGLICGARSLDAQPHVEPAAHPVIHGRCQSHVGRACSGGLPWRVPCRLVLMHASPQGWWPAMPCGSVIPRPPSSASFVERGLLTLSRMWNLLLIQSSMGLHRRACRSNISDEGDRRQDWPPPAGLPPSPRSLKACSGLRSAAGVSALQFLARSTTKPSNANPTTKTHHQDQQRKKPAAKTPEVQTLRP